MNNKGFAITTILYGIMILFCILLVSLLNILSSYKKTQDLLIDSTNGTRDIVSIDVIDCSPSGEKSSTIEDYSSNNSSNKRIFCNGNVCSRDSCPMNE